MHIPEYNSDATKLMISAVSGKSKVLWTHNLEDLFIKAYFGRYHKVHYIEFEKTILFIMLTGRDPYKISMSSVDKQTGAILQKPVQFINRKINL